MNVDAAEPLGGRGHDARDALRAGEIGWDGEHLGARLVPDLAGGGLEGGLIPRADRDPGSLTGRRERRRLAEPLARCRHECDLAVQPQVHEFSPRTVLRITTVPAQSPASPGRLGRIAVPG